jgi:hypothetical protein
VDLQWGRSRCWFETILFGEQKYGRSFWPGKKLFDMLVESDAPFGKFEGTRFDR